MRGDCADLPIDLFFPEVGGGVDPRARAACNGCPVSVECLDEALALPRVDDHGVRAGLSVADRKAIRTRMAGPPVLVLSLGVSCLVCARPVLVESISLEGPQSGSAVAVCPVGHRVGVAVSLDLLEAS